jgi:hypothetical protein
MVAGEEAEAGPWGQEESTSHVDISGMVQADIGLSLGPDLQCEQCLPTS